MRSPSPRPSSPPLILSLMALVLTDWEMIKVRLQSTRKMARKHTSSQGRHPTRSRMDVTWEIQGDRSPIQCLDTHRKASRLRNKYRRWGEPHNFKPRYRAQLSSNRHSQGEGHKSRARGENIGWPKGHNRNNQSRGITQGDRKRTKLVLNCLGKISGRIEAVSESSIRAQQNLQGHRPGSSSGSTGAIYTKILKHSKSARGIASMEQRRGQDDREEEMVDDNFLTTQHLAMRLDAHSTTLNFTLETLSQHRALINQLQDEVDFLRRQGERHEESHGNRAQDIAGQSRSEEGESRDVSILPDLNVALDMPPEEAPAQAPEEKSSKSRQQSQIFVTMARPIHSL
jgi:hypothetical protein